MPLLQITEPGPSDAQAKPSASVAGIDLGTTNSLVAIVADGKPRVLADDQQRAHLPSVVYYHAEEPPLVGDEALAMSEQAPLDTIVSVKRLMGRGSEQIADFKAAFGYRFVVGDSKVPKIKTAAGDKTAVEISADILKALSMRAAHVLGESIEGVVITVPAYFDDAQRQATKDAATLAGLKVYRLLNEPTAAAVAYGLDSVAEEELILVYDLGGGTFDLSVLKMERGVLRVLATGGDTMLGGDDFDLLIAQHFIRQAPTAIEPDSQALRVLLNEARRAKHILSEQSDYNGSVEIADAPQWKISLTRSELEALIGAAIEKTLSICKQVLGDANIDAKQIHNIVLVGGSTRIPLVRRRIQQAIGVAPLVDINPDQVVALGAAIQADVLAGNAQTDDKLLLLDVVPLSLGIETMGGLVERIIPRNSAIPTSRVQEFTTYKDGQTGMALHVVQGERELVADCRSLARFGLKGITPKVAGASKVRVTFNVDADGLLSVSAIDVDSGAQAHVDVKPSYGLSDTDIEQMLRESAKHAKEDVAARNLKEKQVEGRRVLDALAVALSEDQVLLADEEEKQNILAARDKLRHELDHGNADEIKQAMKHLEAISETFIARRMNSTIQKVLHGRSAEEFR
ncbi:MAG: Fe-S protein assembly chaperone HscA [Gammaproteobacteria bacterium]|nr:Fe-S protein assembly chaperone HscA [Gammaproteobacteria bacterium]